MTHPARAQLDHWNVALSDDSPSPPPGAGAVDDVVADFAIRARATRRAGQLIQATPAAKANQHTDALASPGEAGRLAMAKEAGFTEKQATTAMAVANVPTLVVIHGDRREFSDT